MGLKDDNFIIEIFGDRPLFAVANIKNLVLVDEGSYYPQYFNEDFTKTIKKKANITIQKN